MSELDDFISNLHHTTKLISHGTATIMDKTVEAAEVVNLYGQHIVWGMFSVDNRKGKFVGKLANNANTEGVVYHALRGPAVKLDYRSDIFNFGFVEFT